MQCRSLELVETSEHTSSGHTSQNVGASSLHHGHDALVLEDLCSAVQGVLVLDGSSRGHHHSPSDGINGVGHETRGDSDGPAVDEGSTDTSVSPQQHGLQRDVQTEVHTSVDKDTDSRDDESSVKTGDTVSLDGLHVHINKSVEFSLSTLALGIISQSGTGIVEGVHKHKGKSTSHTTAGDVCGKLSGC